MVDENAEEAARRARAKQLDQEIRDLEAKKASLGASPHELIERRMAELRRAQKDQKSPPAED